MFNKIIDPFDWSRLLCVLDAPVMFFDLQRGSYYQLMKYFLEKGKYDDIF